MSSSRRSRFRSTTSARYPHCGAGDRPRRCGLAAGGSRGVRVQVQNAVKSRGGYYLDSEKDFHSPQNLGVVIRPSAMPELTRKYGDDLKAALVGKTVKIIGQVKRRAVGGKGGTATATEIQVTRAGQILSVK